MALKSSHIIIIAAAVLLVAAAFLAYRYKWGNTVLPLDESATVEYTPSLSVGPNPDTDKRKSDSPAPVVPKKSAPALPGMPEEYALTEKQLEQKKRIVSELDSFSGMKPGEDYVANQFIFEAEGEQEAETIAKAYAGKLLSFSYGIATAELADTENYTLLDLLTASADTGNNLPPISLNHIQSISAN